MHSRPSFKTSAAVVSLMLLFALLSVGSTFAYPGSSDAAAAAPCPAPELNGGSRITEYPLPSPNHEPWGIAAGPDGALWFSGAPGNIMSLSPDGVFSEHPFPDMHAAQYFFAAGPDGAMWFNDDWQNSIGRITPDGTINEFPLPNGVRDTDDSGVAYTTSLPRGLVTGADGAIWFTEAYMNNIGRLTTDGTLTEYPVPTANSLPVGIALGSDGALWFVERNGNQIGRITLDGEFTEYPVPTPNSFLLRIAAGPDGALWFSEFNGNNIGRITTDGEITEYALPTAGAGPVGMTAGFGAVWFTEYNGNNIGCITTDGEITEYAIPTTGSVPFSITKGMDGAVWFTENAGNNIGRLQVESTPTPVEAQVVAEWNITMPIGFAFAFDSVWIPSHRSPNVTTRIDPTTNEITAVIEGTGYRAHQALTVDGSMWVTGERDDLAPIDPDTNTIGTPVDGAHPYIAYGFNSIWGVTLTDALDRIDPTTSGITASIELGNGYVDCNNHVVVTASSVWILHCDEGELIQIDPTSNSIVTRTPYDTLISQATAQTTVPTGNGTDFIWTLSSGGLLRIDPNTVTGVSFLPLTREQIGDGWFTVTDEAVWVGGTGQIERVDVATNQIDAIYEVHDGYPNIGIGFDSVWVAYEQSGLVQRLDIVP